MKIVKALVIFIYVGKTPCCFFAGATPIDFTRQWLFPSHRVLLLTLMHCSLQYRSIVNCTLVTTTKKHSP